MNWLRKILAWWKGRFNPTLLAADIVPPEQPEPQPNPEDRLRANRAMRRRLERARRRKDKLVTPKGELPVRLPSPIKTEPRAKVKKPVDLSLVDEKFIVDEHHEGGQVLYEASEQWGEFNFRDTILDQLELYFIYLARMKLRDCESYEFYKQVGATILPYTTTGVDDDLGTGSSSSKVVKRNIKPLPPHFNENRPTFGAFVFCADPLSEDREANLKCGGKKELWLPKFLYFIKYSEPPPEVQPMSGGDVYKITVWWDKPNDPKYKHIKGGAPEEYALFISRDGKSMQALKTIDTALVPIQAKKRDRGSVFHIPQRAWHIPNELEQWARQHGTDAQTFLVALFVDTVTTSEFSNYSMVRVAATKNGMTAIFGVNVRRMSYFFKDRDIEVNEKGIRKKVFHMVRGHERQTTRGKQHVKWHFRGEREFTWAGYKIMITVPAHDHFLLPELNIGTSDEYWHHGEKMMSNKQFGKEIVDWIKRGIR